MTFDGAGRVSNEHVVDLTEETDEMGFAAKQTADRATRRVFDRLQEPSVSPEEAALLLGNRVAPRRLSPRRILPWLAGADAKTLTLVPWERTAFTLLGLALLVPPIIGWVGITVMLHMVTRSNNIDGRFVAAGAGWAVVIVVVDRLLVKGRVRYKRERDPETGLPVLIESTSTRASIAVWCVRLTLALALSTFAAEPLIASLYGKEAVQAAQTQQKQTLASSIKTIETQRDADLASEQTRLQPQLSTLQAEIKPLQNEIASQNAQVKSLSDACQTELLRGQNGRPAGPGTFYKTCEGDLNVVTEQRDKIVGNDKTRIATLNGEITHVDAPLASISDTASKNISTLRATKSLILSDLGAWRRIELTNKLIPLWYRLALAAIIFCLDALAILGKGLLGRFTHDDLHALASETARSIWSDHFHEELETAYARRTLQRLATARVTKAIARPGGTMRAGGRSSDPPGRPGQRGSAATDDPVETADTVSSTPGEPDQPTPESIRQLTVGARTIRYLADPVGVGGLATVHKGFLKRLASEPAWVGEDVAVKIPRDNSDARAMLERELRFYDQHGALLHDAAPEYLLVRSWGDSDRDTPPFLILRYYPRLSLDRFLLNDDGSVRIELPASVAVAWLRNLVDLLRDVWGRGLVHGDGKPDNILVNGTVSESDFTFVGTNYVKGAAGTLRLCDFSTAAAEGTPSVTYPSVYAPPEYASAGELHRLGDVYSFLGATGYFILTGNAPDPAVDVRSAAIAQNPALTRLPGLVDRVTAWLDPIPERRVAATDQAEIGEALAHDLERLASDIASDGTGALLVHKGRGSDD